MAEMAAGAIADLGLCWLFLDARFAPQSLNKSGSR